MYSSPHAAAQLMRSKVFTNFASWQKAIAQTGHYYDAVKGPSERPVQLLSRSESTARNHGTLRVLNDLIYVSNRGRD